MYLWDLDIGSGQCVNSSIPQNVTFGEQGGVVGHSSGAAPGARVSVPGAAVAAVLAAFILL